MKNYLGIDWGEKDIGVALAHAETRVAVALAILPHDRTLWKKLARLLEENDVSQLVIGAPLYQETGTLDRVKRFANEVGNRFPAARVSLFNEMFTSKLAGEKLRDKGGKPGKDHAEAARIILEEWLEKKSLK